MSHLFEEERKKAIMVSVYVRERPQWWIMDPKFSKWGNVNVSGMRKKYVEVKKLSCWWSAWFIGDFYCEDSLRLPCTYWCYLLLRWWNLKIFSISFMIICQVKFAPVLGSVLLTYNFLGIYLLLWVFKFLPKFPPKFDFSSCKFLVIIVMSFPIL